MNLTEQNIQMVVSVISGVTKICGSTGISSKGGLRGMESLNTLVVNPGIHHRKIN